MKLKSFFTSLLLLVAGAGTQVGAQNAVTVGSQVTDASNIVSGKAYLLRWDGLTGTPYALDTGGDNYGMANNNTATQAAVYYLISDGNGGYKIENAYTGKYWPTPSSNGQAIAPTTAANAGIWTIAASATTNRFTFTCSGYHTNRSSSKLVAHTTDSPVSIYEVTTSTLSTTATYSAFTDKDISVSATEASSISEGQWYVMSQRSRTSYVFENTSDHKLKHTLTKPSGSATEKAGYLVRLLSADGGKYYLQNGFGNYMGTIEASTNVPTTALGQEAITVAKIGDTDGHFYLQGTTNGTTNGVILDGNDFTLGDPSTVVGYGTGAPSTTGGNNDWAFYPVEFVDSWVPTISEVYTINNTNSNRGAMMYNGSSSYVWSSGKSGTFSATDPNCQWVLVPTGTATQYYLYNVGAGKFAIPSATSSTASWIFSSDAVAVTFITQNDGTKKIKTVTTDTYAAVSNGYNGPIINYNDVGGNFTVTKVDGDQSSVATAAFNKLVDNKTAASAVPASGSDGWYIIRIRTHASYADKFVYPLENEVTYSGTNYPLSFDHSFNLRPAIDNATYYTRIIREDGTVYWQLPNGKYLYGANSKFPISTFDKSSFSMDYTSGSGIRMWGSSRYAVPYYLSSQYFIGETSTGTNAYYDLYPIDLATAGLTAWQLVADGLDADTKVTCTRSDVKGLTSVYNNGFFFLPTEQTPATTGEFTANIGGSDISVPVTVNTEAHTITVNLPTLTINSPMAEATFTWNGETKTGKSVTFTYSGQEITDNTITVSYSGVEYTSPSLSASTWDGTSSTTVTLSLTPAFFSTNYGDKWVRIQSAKNTSLTATLSGTSVYMKSFDYADENQLWCFVGNSSSFTIYNKAAGSGKVLVSGVAVPGNNTTITLQNEGTANSTWTLGTGQLTSDDAPGYALYATGGDGSYSMHGWQNNGTALKYWGAGSGGSHFLIEDANAEVELEFAGLDPSAMTVYTQNIANIPITLGGSSSSTLLKKDNFASSITAYVPVGSEVTLGTPKMFQNYSFSGYGGGLQTKTITATAGANNITATFGSNRIDARYLWEPLRIYSGSGEKDYYRIPAIVTAKDGDVIAICDRRFNNGSDIGGNHHIDLIGIASSDNGNTWGSEFMVMDGDNGGEKGYGDAAVVADRENNQILVMACGGNISYQSESNSDHQSIDRVVLTKNGSGVWTASAITNVASQFYAGTLASSNGMFIGSGSISQSKIIKKGAYYRIYCAVLAKEGNFAFYSDDFGETWTMMGTARAANDNEAKIEELPDGSVLLSVRKSYGRTFNVWTWSDNTYTTGSWGTAVATNNQTGGISFGGNSTNGDIRMIPAVKVSDGSAVTLAMQSVPTGGGRSNVSIYYKELANDGTYTDPATVAQNWIGPFEVTPHNSAYSAFNLQPDGRIGFFMEEAPISMTEASVGYYMCYVPLTLDEITGGDYMAAPSTLTNNRYYRLLNYSHTGKYMTENTLSHTVVCSNLSDSYSQVWKAEIDGSNIALKNVLTDRYLQNVSHSDWSEQYQTAASSANFTLVSKTGGSYAFDDGWNAGPHCDASSNVVYWSYTDDNTASWWYAEEVTVDDAELAAQKDAFTEVETATLTTYFTDAACTALKSPYSGYPDEALRGAMSALPATVQNMAVKVKNGSWATYGGWDKTEETFRIADYKAYSKHDRWSNIIGTSYVFGRLTNPTGIYAEAGEYIHVYVGTIPSGETVKLEVVDEHQSTGSLYTLHEGMNSLLMASSGNCFVNYEVDNTTDGGEPYTDINDYDPVTVHIEGGSVNGYFDLTKGDDNTDWAQLQAHLLQASPDVELKTGNLLFHMNTSLVTSACPTNMVELLGEWDKILDMEYSLLGLEDFDGYWNNLLSATDVTSSYMYATNYGTYYETSTISSVMSYADLFAGGAIWGPAHENGHIMQRYINMVGQTEVSNNLFSNVAIYNNGHKTSRASYISTTFENMANDVFWNDRGIWERTHLYFQLYQFFHILGNKSDFYPELFKALRSDPMVHSGGTFISAADDYLKFYKKCCSVSGYDLTEFFQAYGFFVIPTMTSQTLSGVTKDAYHIEDYANYYLTVTQAEIDAAKAEVAAMNLPKANIIFIEDRVKAPDATYEGAAAGEKKIAISDEFPIGPAGETGQYTDFNALCSPYSYNVADGYVTMSGSGAVGFKLYDEDSNLVGLYNTNTFKLPTGLTNYTIKAADGMGGDVEATYNSTGETFPKADTWYTFCSTLRNNLYTRSGGAGNGVYGLAQTTGTQTADMKWKFVDHGDGTYDIISHYDNSYLNPVADYNTQITTTATQPASGWTLAAANTDGMWIIHSGTVELYQTNKDNTLGYKVFNWSDGGTGNDTSDNGCQFTIMEAQVEDAAEGFDLLVSATPANDLNTGTWYVMYDRGGYRAWLYENESNQLYNTYTEPGLVRSDSHRFLVRLMDAGSSKYYIQTGRGNFLEALTHGTVVPTGNDKEKFTVAKISSNDAHFYLQGANNVVLDANEASGGDATVVGYGTTVPTSTDGNNDWAFYPVTLVPHFAPTAMEMYTFNNTNSDRGAMTYDAAKSEKFVWSSGKGGATAFDAASANCQWVFVPAETTDQYYLYNVGKQKFVVPTRSGSYEGLSWMFSSDAAPVQLFLQSDGTYKMNTPSGGTYLSVSNNYTGPIINYNDAGAQFTITKQGNIGLSDMAALSAAYEARPATTKTMALNAVGDKSYATLYLDYDAQTDENTKAYYITETTTGYVTLTEVANEGRNIPAYTAVVLINENATTNPTFSIGFSVSNGYARVVTEDDNMLKGTLTSMDLDLSDETPYYSLGRKDDTIGFYKFKNGETTSITLGANKAYLDTTAPGGAVKGFHFSFDDANSIVSPLGETEEGASIYNLSGQRLSKPQKGINIINGKKVLIK